VYKVELSRQAGKDLERVFRSDRKLYQRFLNAFQSIAHNPLEGKPLQGELKGLRSYRLGSYRILYEVRHGELLVVVIDLGHHREVYKQLLRFRPRTSGRAHAAERGPADRLAGAPRGAQPIDLCIYP